MATKMHPVAAKGFNAGAALYAIARPNYAPAAVSSLIAQIQNAAKQGEEQKQPLVLELGSGTGIFSRHLLNAFGSSNVRFIEPAEGMRAEFNASVGVEFGVTAQDGMANATGLPDASVDAVVCAQAFHWFADAPTIREFRRILRPNGLLALIWNLEDPTRADWVAKVRTVYEQHELGTPQYRLGLWRAIFNPSKSPETAQVFKLPLREEHFNHAFVAPGGLDAIWNRIHSKSYILTMDSETREKLKAQVFAVLKESDVELDANGNVVYPYVTDLYTSIAI
ncbi:hypothetical protein HK100_005741 [Physocladia obscura]|uniref:Methyltransferase type 11 domain-containing protein n=1 Tax=Physocladia obscura TaxID=109957 RepID=A0AAD5X7X0_9FUNG|nr:hypothetical protein HK100_005741 [Physocladia obscura]